MSDATEFQHMLRKCREAQQGSWPVLSTGEKLMAALVLNRSDWLKTMDYTIAEALRRVGPQWVGMIPDVAQRLDDDAQA